ncbi:MAG: hypothetical protein V3W41_02310 [Planctomycetota bacterium]
MPRIKLPAIVVALTMCSVLCGCNENENELRSSQSPDPAAESTDAGQDHGKPHVVPEFAQVLTREAGGVIRVAFPPEGVALQDFSRQLRRKAGIRLVIDPNSDLPTRTFTMIDGKTFAAKDLTSFVEVICFAHDLEIRELKLATAQKERVFLVTRMRTGCSLGRRR